MDYLDSLDVRILRELIHDSAGYSYQPDFRRSFLAIGSKLGVDPHVIRQRYSKLLQVGFLRGWRLIVNPDLFELKFARLWFDVGPKYSAPSAKDEAIEKIRRLPGIMAVINHLGSSMLIVMSYSDEADLTRLTELIQLICNAQNLVVTRRVLPSCKLKLSKQDWNIVTSLYLNPRAQYSSVAKDLQLSTKTVKRRLQRMIEGSAVFISPLMSAKTFPNVSFADLLVCYTSPTLRGQLDREILSKFDSYFVHAELREEHGSFNLLVPNASTAQEILRWTTSQPCVESARINLVADYTLWYEPQIEEVQRMIKRLQSQFC
jgi:DNA-binding Lrp family transcriptional regulator